VILNKKMNPLVSIIICTYNSKSTIADTMLSIKKQKYKNYQVIIIDNNSSDNTLEIINNYKISNIKFIKFSSKLYEAINKGIEVSNGKVISILHSDDYYYDKFVLSKVAQTFKDSKIDIVYGDLLYVKKYNKNKILRYWQSDPYKKKYFLRGWSPPHPTFFCRKKIYLTGKLYKTNIENSADVELMHRYLEIIGFKSRYLKKILVVMRYGGMSNNSFKKMIFQNIAILKFLKIHKKPFAITNFFVHKLINRFTQFLHGRKYNNHQFKRFFF